MVPRTWRLAPGAEYPVCRQSLALDADALRCTGCGRRYPVVDGIPVLLADRAS
jgi:uncharacterized protein YbaR (Trm112 family)